MAHFVVVGGGISGLAAAESIVAAGHQVTVIEAAASTGGKLRSSLIGGFVVDEGADAFLVRVAEAVDLVARLGLRLTHPATTTATVWSRGRLRPMPSGSVMGVPGSVRTLAETGVVGAVGTARAALDLVLPRTNLPADPTVGEFARARLGRPVVDALIEPLLGGVYAGNVDELSWRATLPQLERALTARSLIRSAKAALPSGGATAGPVFGSVPGGLGALAAALTAAVVAAGAIIRTQTTARALERRDRGWRVHVGAASGPETGRDVIDADGVVLAVPATPTARLLEAHAPTAARTLEAIRYASVAIVTLLYPPEARQFSLSGSGFLVPSGERRLVKAVTFTSHKWPELGKGAGFIIRASVGRAGEEANLQRDDVELGGVAAAEVAELTGLTARPTDTRVTRWGGALPQYRSGHLDRVAAIRDEVTRLDAVAVCGAAYEGVGIPACIRSGQAAAAELLRGWAHV